LKAAYFDCFSGISGDMCLGAVIDAGLDFSALETALQGLALSGYKLTATKVVKQGISAVKADVLITDNTLHQPRGLAEITAIIEQSHFPEKVKDDALKVFRKLATAEARVHGVSVEAVHLHEVGAVDAIVDIVGTVLGLHLLGVSAVYASPLPLGGGTVCCEHGILPVPAPATLELLKGIPTTASPVQSELVTPTGAAIVATLAGEIGILPQMTVRTAGYGAGDKDFPHPNVMRLIIGDIDVPESCLPLEQGFIAVIEATIDDMNPEFYSFLGEGLLAAGAVDYYYTPVYMKKQRPGTKVTVLSDIKDADRIAGYLLAQTTTLGCRIRKEQRLIADRKVMQVATSYGKVEVKFSPTTKTVSPEYESCWRTAKAAGVSVKEVYDAAKAKAWNLLQE